MGHAHLQTPHAARRAALDQRLQARQQRLAALDAEPLQRTAVRFRVGSWSGSRPEPVGMLTVLGCCSVGWHFCKSVAACDCRAASVGI